MLQHDQETVCRCGSGLSYEACCKPYHQGSQWPENALKLMKSRYVAYALNLPEYIIRTTHPASPQYQANVFAWKRSITKFSQSQVFQKLEVVDFIEHDSFATVVFIAHLASDHTDNTFCERSYFEKLKGHWLYKWGELIEGHEPNFSQRGQLQLLPLAYYGDPILTKQAEPIEHINEDLRILVDKMTQTMDVCHGMGLAAPQVHHSIRLFIMRQPILQEGHLDLGDLKVFINPKILPMSSETWKTAEGCLSIPALRGDVERAKSICVEYTDLEGQRKTAEFFDWEARIILHEYDHLNGVLFLEHLDAQQKKALEPSLKQLQQRLHDSLEL